MAGTAVVFHPLHRHHTEALASQQRTLFHPLSLKIKQLASSERKLCLLKKQVPMAGASETSSGTGVYRTAEQIKTELFLALQGKLALLFYIVWGEIVYEFSFMEGANRGVFGLTTAKKLMIGELVEQLERRNPTPNPTDQLLYKVNGCWKLIYSTITILGSKRTKLGLRDFIILGDLYQTIDVSKERAINVINFSAKGLKLLTGQLTIEASYKIASKTRVNIKLENSRIMPDQLMNLFQKNYDLLIEIFNPAGWLDITYVDDSLRIGRNDKGAIFVLERAAQDSV